MIRHKLSSLRTTQKPYLIPTLTNAVESPPLPAPVTVMTQSLMAEASRRDKIVQRLYKECPYMEGDKVTIADDEYEKEYGKDILVEKICSRYSHLGISEKWPESDVPMIVQAWSNDTSKRFYCTTGFLKKL